MTRLLGAARTDKGLHWVVDHDCPGSETCPHCIQLVPVTRGYRRLLEDVLSWLRDPANWEPPVLDTERK